MALRPKELAPNGSDLWKEIGDACEEVDNIHDALKDDVFAEDGNAA